jgi:hypothetical protein
MLAKSKNASVGAAGQNKGNFGKTKKRHEEGKQGPLASVSVGHGSGQVSLQGNC